MHPSPTAAPFDAVHVGFHQQDAAAGALVEVFLQRGVGDAGAVEAGALVFDDDLGEGGRDGGLDVDVLLHVVLVAVLDGVDERFLKGELDGERALAVEAGLFDGVEDALLHVVAGGEVGANGERHRCVIVAGSAVAGPVGAGSAGGGGALAGRRRAVALAPPAAAAVRSGLGHSSTAPSGNSGQRAVGSGQEKALLAFLLPAARCLLPALDHVKLASASARVGCIRNSLFSFVMTKTSKICGLMFVSRNCPFFCFTRLLALISMPRAAELRWSTFAKSSSNFGPSFSSIKPLRLAPISAMLASSRILLLVNSTMRVFFSFTTEIGGMGSDMPVVSLRERRARRWSTDSSRGGDTGRAAGGIPR